MIPEIIRHLVTHVLTLTVQNRLDAGAVAAGPKVEGEEKWLLRYSWSYRAVWLGMTLVWGAALALFGWLWWTSDLGWQLLATLPLFLGLFAFSIRSVREGFAQEIEVSPSGVVERRWGAITRAVPWSLLERVDFVTYLDSYRLFGREGQSILCGMHIRGIRRFKVCVARYAPYDVFESVRARIGNFERP